MKKWIIRIIVMSIAGMIVMGAGMAAYLAYRLSQLPTVANLREVKIEVPLKIYSRDGRLLGEFGEIRRTPLDYANIPKLFAYAFVSAEDDDFFTHTGVDIRGILRALFVNVITQSKAQGASTITMQLARNYYLSNIKTLSRKRDEILLAWRIEKAFTKQEILELYLNKIFFGHRAYGIAAAAQVYYGKEVSELTLPQMAMIAGLPKAPSLYNPIRNLKRAVLRRNYVLKRMLELGYINQQQHDESVATEDDAHLHKRSLDVESMYVADSVRQILIDKFGEKVYREGYNVYTTVDADMQREAAHAMWIGLLGYDKRHGFHGPVGHVDLQTLSVAEDALDLALDKFTSFNGIEPALVISDDEMAATLYHTGIGDIRLSSEAMEWALKDQENHSVVELLKPGDVVYLEHHEGQWMLSQIPKVEGALLAEDPNTGAIKAMVGGFDYFKSKFNRSLLAKRQPGSNFKPFLYSAFLQKGHTVATIVPDLPLNLPDWEPAKPPFFGDIRLRIGLAFSRNLVAARVLQQLGLDDGLQYVSRFGFSTDVMPRNLTLALGTAEVTQKELVRGYSVFANGGYLIEPYLIERIADARGHVLMEQAPLEHCETECAKTETMGLAIQESGRTANRVITKSNAFLMTHMLQSTIKIGTARAAQVLNRNDLAGKTGTTNDQKDAWFTGYNQNLVASVWVGFDEPQTLGANEFGSMAALPVWIDFMGKALQKVEDKPWPIPSNVVSVRIDPVTGLLAPPDMEDFIWDYFENGTQPTQYASTEKEEQSEEYGDPFR